ncbi:MAG: hypothetical protein ABIR94_18870 [Rubrivivax sp.]
MQLARRDNRTLTGASLVLTRRSLPAGWVAFIALSLAALLVGMGGSQIYRSQQQATQHTHSAAQQRTQTLQVELDEAMLLQRMSAARTQELEREIDTLNRSLRESLEELAFLRKARDARRPQ